MLPALWIHPATLLVPKKRRMTEKTGRLLTDGDAKTRSLPRMPVTLPVRFCLFDEVLAPRDEERKPSEKEQADSHQGGWALDLSLGGMLLRCDASAGSMEAETKLHVQFPVGIKWLNATGKVVWTQSSPSDNSHLLGICFIDFEGEDEDLLQRFMESPST